jgi:transaldolase
VMIKVPATEPGVRAIEKLTARGVNVNVTLLFSVARYEEMIDAYMRGLERRLQSGRSLEPIASVASFFVSRVDAKVDPLLPAGSPLRGRVAIANARLAYARYLDRFSDDACLADDRWRALRDAGARPQRPLWASTGTKNPDYSDVLYIERLITRDAVNTMPVATLRAFADHGDLHHPLGVAGAANATLRRARAAGVDLDAITAELEREGVSAFCESYQQLLDAIQAKVRPTRPTGDGAHSTLSA